MGVIRLEVPRSSNGRVTAGIPSLDPSTRFVRDRQEAKRVYQSALHADEKQKRESAVAPDGSRDRTNQDAQRGLELHSYEITRRLRALNPSLFALPVPGRSDVLGLYVSDPNVEGGKKFVCGFEKEVSPEFEVIEYHVEEQANGLGGYEKVKVCDGTKRGWRTILLKCIKAGIISQAGAERMFGTPTHDSQRWQQSISL